MYDQLIFHIRIEEPPVVYFIDRVKFGRDVKLILIANPIQGLRIYNGLAERQGDIE
jgi:hypothetical protein